MTCERHIAADGTVTTFCARGQRRRAVPCGVCRRVTATRLCDGQVPGRGRRPRTCSAPLCEGCSEREGEVDRCPDCAARQREEVAAVYTAPAQGSLFG